MSREIKFRVWHEYQQRFLDEDAEVHYYTVADLRYPNEGEVAEQYTGLKDKNGKEIYEGDIVILGYVIQWCDREKHFAPQGLYDDDVYCYSCNGDILWHEIVEDKELEIIGNIHENKELLEE